MGTKLNLREAEELLACRYNGKWCSFEYPGYDVVHGLVNDIAIDITKPEPIVVVKMNDKRYTCSVPDLKECLKLLK